MTSHRLVALTCALFCAIAPVFSQNLEFERVRHREILRLVKEDFKKNYYDPTFKGVDIEAKHKVSIEKMEKAESIGQMSGTIAQFLLDFDDSHLFFVPPGKNNKTDYGFEFRMIGAKCLVTSIDKKSEAEKAGLQVGDELYSIDGFSPTRENLWKLQYLLYALRPRAGLNLEVRKPDGREVKYAVAAKITQGKRVMDLTGTDLNTYIRESEDRYRASVKQYFYEKLDGVFIWRMPGFNLEPGKVDDIMGRAKKAPALILDLRRN